MAVQQKQIEDFELEQIRIILDDFLDNQVEDLEIQIDYILNRAHTILNHVCSRIDLNIVPQDLVIRVEGMRGLPPANVNVRVEAQNIEGLGYHYIVHFGAFPAALNQRLVITRNDAGVWSIYYYSRNTLLPALDRNGEPAVVGPDMVFYTVSQRQNGQFAHWANRFATESLLEYTLRRIRAQQNYLLELEGRLNQLPQGSPLWQQCRDTITECIQRLAVVEDNYIAFQTRLGLIAHRMPTAVNAQINVHRRLYV